jgi:hypothetical protein
MDILVNDRIDRHRWWLQQKLLGRDDGLGMGFGGSDGLLPEFPENVAPALLVLICLQ